MFFRGLNFYVIKTKFILFIYINLNKYLTNYYYYNFYYLKNIPLRKQEIRYIFILILIN